MFDLLMAIYLFLLGLAFGSFALAMTDRMIASKDWVAGRSACDFCGHLLHAKDLIPVLSWTAQKGKCRYCRKKLSWQYPLAELAVGTIFVGSYFAFPFALSGAGLVLFVLWLLAIVIMTALFIYDLRLFLLPNKLIRPLIAVALCFRLVQLFFVDENQSLGYGFTQAGLAVLVAAGVFALLHIVSQGKWIGDGDVRLGVAMGLFLPGPFEAWLALFTASSLGMVVALPKLAKSRKNMKMKLPFGPLLIFGLIIAFLWGSRIIDWYVDTFLYLG